MGEPVFWGWEALEGGGVNRQKTKNRPRKYEKWIFNKYFSTKIL